MKRALSARLVFVVMLLALAAPRTAQVVAFPEWGSDPFSSDNPDLSELEGITMPAFGPESGIRLPMFFLPSGRSQCGAHGLRVERSWESGVLAVRGPGGQKFGIETGLDRTYELELHRDGVTAVGLLAVGRVGVTSRVRYMPFKEGATHSSFVFTTLIDAAPGEIYLFADMFGEGDGLWLYEATKSRIEHRGDSDDDGMPDAKGPVATVIADNANVGAFSFDGFDRWGPWISVRDADGPVGPKRRLRVSGSEILVDDLPRRRAAKPEPVDF